jgi:hypothetical protein
VADDAFDPGLLARVTAQPQQHPRRRTSRIALPIAGATAIAAVIAVIAATGPNTSPASAAISQALRWFDPAPGTILHFRSVLTSAAPDGTTRTVMQEVWQSADHPDRQRHIERDGSRAVEAAGDEIYDPATNTIFEPTPNGRALREQQARAIERKIAAAKANEAPAGVIRRLQADARQALAGTLETERVGTPPAGDPTVAKLRMLLNSGAATVRGRETHDGVEAWAITLPSGHVTWTLWTAVADGRPLELRGGSETTRWTTYEAVDGAAPDQLLTLTGAHPDARVVRDPGAEQRLFPNG